MRVKGGFRTRPRVLWLTAAVSLARWPGWILTAAEEEHRRIQSWDLREERARRCPHAAAERRAVDFGYIECADCDTFLRTGVQGWAVDPATLEQPNACGCSRLRSDYHWDVCPTRYLEPDGSLKAEPNTAERLPGVKVVYMDELNRGG